MCDHPNESRLAFLFCVLVMMPYKMASHTVVVREFALGGGKYNFPNTSLTTTGWEATYKTVLTGEFVAEILKCDYSNESFWAVFCKMNLVNPGSFLFLSPGAAGLGLPKFQRVNYCC